MGGFVVGSAIVALLAVFVLVMFDHMPRDLYSWLKIPRWYLILGVVILVWAGIVYMITTPSYKKWALVIDIIFYGTVPFTGVAGFFMQSGLRDPERVIWWRVLVSILLFVSISFAFGYMGYGGTLGSILAFFGLAFPATEVAIVIAIWMIFSLPIWRKFVSLAVAIVFPIVFFISIGIGLAKSPESLITSNMMNNRKLIVQSLQQHHADHHSYPAELTELVPAYLTELPEALTTQGTGWLYDSTGDQYTLGYWYSSGKYSVMLCLYRSENAYWGCDPTEHNNGWGPFKVVSTPTPSPTPASSP